MNKLDLDYQKLLQDILDNGVKKQDRTGTGTLSVFGRSIRYKFKDGKFPLLTTKKMPFKTIVTELLWFLRGETNIKWLVEQKNYIWVGDAYKKYVKDESVPIKWLFSKAGHEPVINDDFYRHYTEKEFIEKILTDDEFAKKYGDLGPIYGKQWRNWETRPNIETKPYFHKGETHFTFDINEQPHIDQIQNLINDLKNNPDSRRLIVNAWNVAEIDQMTLPPCHYGFQVYTRELTWAEQVQWVLKNTDVELENLYIVEEIAKPSTPKRAISLMFNMRSNDVPLGLPFNIASYGLLLEILGKMVNMVPEELIGNLGDTHIYINQIDGIKEQLTREPYKLPTLKFEKTDEFFKSLSDDLSLLNHLEISDFKIENYESHPTIKIPLSN